MKRFIVAALLATVPSCTLVGLGAGAGFDNVAGTDHIGKDVGLRLGLGFDIALVSLLMRLVGGHRD